MMIKKVVKADWKIEKLNDWMKNGDLRFYWSIGEFFND